MKVLLINASPRKDGNTYVALSEAARVLQEEGFGTGFFHIGSQPVRGCAACGACARDNNLRCAFDDDITNRLIEAAQTADAFIFGTPTYFGQPNGALLAVLQRALYAARPVFAFKPVASVVVARRGGATAALQTMNMPFQMCNMPVVTSQYWNIVYGAAKGEARLDAEGLQTMRTMAHNLAWLMRSLAAEPHYDIDSEPHQRTNFIR